MAKKIFNNFLYLIIAILIIIILLQRRCDGVYTGKNHTPKPDTVTVIKWDTLRYSTTVYVPKWKTKIEHKHHYHYDTIIKYNNIDTAAILRDYFTLYAYNDTIKNDTVSIYITDSITRNNILNRQVSYNIKYPTIETIITKYANNREFYIGGSLGGNTKGFKYIGGEFLYRSRKSKAFGVGLGLNNNFEPIITGKVYWKLGRNE